MGAQLLARRDGWYEWTDAATPGVLVQVRLTEDSEGRRQVTDLQLTGGITNEVLRAVSISRIESAADVQLGGWGHSTSGSVAKRPALRSATSMPDVEWAIPNAGNVRVRTKAEDGSSTDPAPSPIDRREPGKRGLSDDHYRAIAEEYLERSVESHSPAADIALEYGKPVTTVHRWVREARRRGYLPSGRPGRAG